MTAVLKKLRVIEWKEVKTPGVVTAEDHLLHFP